MTSPSRFGSTTSNAPTGSNRAQWDAMDLHTARTQRRPQGSDGGHPTASNPSMTTTTASSTTSTNVATHTAATRRLEGTGLSARNLLLRRKLQERRRFDSADHAMQKFAASSRTSRSSETSTSSSTSTSGGSNLRGSAPAAVTLLRTASEPIAAGTASTPVVVSTSAATPVLSCGRMGASLFSSAIESGGNVHRASAGSTSAAVSASTAATSRYGALSHPSASNALSARNILIQKKMKVKKKFDSADWQLERYERSRGSACSTGSNSSAIRALEDESDSSTAPSSPMETERASPYSPLGSDPETTVINSPVAMDAATRRARMLHAQMSQAMRGRSAGKYGNLSPPMTSPNASNVSFFQRRMGDTCSNLSGRTQLANPMEGAGAMRHSESDVPTPPAAPLSFATETSAGGSFKYGRLCAANVMMRRHLKDRKYFDSGEYFMEREREQQHRHSHEDATHRPDDTGGRGSTGEVSTRNALQANYGTMERDSQPRAEDTRPAWRYRPHS